MQLSICARHGRPGATITQLGDQMLAHFSVRTRLFVLATVPLLSLVGVIILALICAGQLDAKMSHLFNDRMVPLGQLKRISDAYAVDIVDGSQKFRAGMQDERAYRNGVESAMREISEAWSDYSATEMTREERVIAKALGAQLDRANLFVDKLLMQAKDGELTTESIQSFNERLFSVIDPLSRELDALLQLQLDEGFCCDLNF
jgi:methyl-accepting chemotaxis protein